MKFIVSSGALLKNLQNVAGIIGSNNVLPILEDFKFDIGKDKIVISATDLETFMKVEMDSAEVTGKGSICIPAKVLLDYLKNVSEQPISFEIHDDYRIDITSSSGKSHIVGEDVKQFPPEPVSENLATFTMPAAELSDAIAKTLVAVSNDDMRPAMSGVFFEIEENAITFVSTDGHRLIRCIKTGIEAKNNGSFIVTKKSLSQLKNTLQQAAEVSISYDESIVVIEGEKLKLISRLIDARFPDYKVVIPANNPYTLLVPRDEFLSCLRRVNVFANKTTNQVEIEITGNSLRMLSSDLDYSYEGDEQMNCNYTGEDMRIAFNAKFLVEMLPFIDDEELRIELSQPIRPGILKPANQKENEDLLMLVMPLMLNNYGTSNNDEE